MDLGFELGFPGWEPGARFTVTQFPVCHVRTKHSGLFVPLLENKGFQAREVRENATYLFQFFQEAALFDPV